MCFIASGSLADRPRRRGVDSARWPIASQDSTPYVDALLAYSARDPGRFQVPGHKGGAGADPAMRELVGEIGLRNDIPSVTEGVDIGPEPTPFQQAQLLAAEAWGAQRTWFLSTAPRRATTRPAWPSPTAATASSSSATSTPR